jgi:hypothetical protein
VFDDLQAALRVLKAAFESATSEERAGTGQGLDDALDAARHFRGALTAQPGGKAELECRASYVERAATAGRYADAKRRVQGLCKQAPVFRKLSPARLLVACRWGGLFFHNPWN